jgi:hypothetical protein
MRPRDGETPCVFLAGLYRAERSIADRPIRLTNDKPPWPWIDPDKALPWAEKQTVEEYDHGCFIIRDNSRTALAAIISPRRRLRPEPSAGVCFI